VAVELSGDSKSLYFVVENRDTHVLQLTPELYYYSPTLAAQSTARTRLHYSITTDKGFYKPAEVVHVKGALLLLTY
jgi:hypothetical protein